MEKELSLTRKINSKILYQNFIFVLFTFFLNMFTIGLTQKGSSCMLFACPGYRQYV